jgi:hypothetical protein
MSLVLEKFKQIGKYGITWYKDEYTLVLPIEFHFYKRWKGSLENRIENELGYKTTVSSRLERHETPGLFDLLGYVEVKSISVYDPQTKRKILDLIKMKEDDGGVGRKVNVIMVNPKVPEEKTKKCLDRIIYAILGKEFKKYWMKEYRINEKEAEKWLDELTPLK